MRGKIIKGIAGFYYVSAPGGIYECKAKGIFRNQKLKPLVGDDVEIEILEEEKKLGNMVGIERRSSELIRPNVANAEQALLMFAAVSPEPHLGLVDRFLVMMEYQSVPAAICINKTDQGVPETLRQQIIYYERAGYPVYYISTKTGTGLDEIKEYLDAKTTVLAGPSGVGKSSFLNVMSKEDRMEVGTISKKLGRGRHTTRHCELFPLWEETYVCDTPGFSSMDLPDVKAEQLRYYFPEMDRYEGTCRFSGCVHLGEPDCKVKEAVAAGIISRSRYDSYCMFGEELKNRRRRYD